VFTNPGSRPFDRRIATGAWLLAASVHGLLIMAATTWPPPPPAQPATRPSRSAHLVFVGVSVDELARLSGPQAPKTLQVSASRIAYPQDTPGPLSRPAPKGTLSIEPSAEHLDEFAPLQHPAAAVASHTESPRLVGEASVPPVSPAPATVSTGSFDKSRAARRVSDRPPAATGAFDRSPSVNRVSVNTTASTVVTATFDMARARSSQSGARVEAESAGYGRAVISSVEARPPASHAAAMPGPVEVPLEILSKAVPSYSESARTAGIEGEVVLEVEFASSGSARVRRVVRGLGFGLDERAVAAIEQIRFTPARSQGVPVSIVAQVSVTFRLSR